MTESFPAAQVAATVKSCEQYRFRVELPCTLSKQVRADIRGRALREVNRVFLECTRQFQAGSWAGEANLAFTDGRSTPSDSKSEFLHLLVCLKTVELCVEALKGSGQNAGILAIATCLRFEPREAFAGLAGELGLTLHLAEGIVGGSVLKSPIAENYRSPGRSHPPFLPRPAKRIDDFRNALARRLADRRALKVSVDTLLLAVSLPFRTVSALAYFAFSLWYRPRALRLLQVLDGPRNLFVYFDMRLGKDREVPPYLKWKFGSALSLAHPPGIPFTHFARPGAGQCLAAMAWAADSLRRGIL